ncbi:uncharacterized protein LOC9637195 [Selaginella moellendorffii]|nr:uncharacterized protein LOC9637195 [Selaginella moellendorffii]XP_024535280.1 uncharacterized protein LOC9637195 [Selaginella moellendorffii]|eukprot:XP_002974734.2 uncharacterized protein LOC9637195 [Selaginella moellendorffii]
MAFRQGSGAPMVNGDHKSNAPARSSARGHDSDVESNGSRGRVKKAPRKGRQCSAGLYLAILLGVVGFTLLGSDFIGRALVVVPGDLGTKDDFFNHPDTFAEIRKHGLKHHRVTRGQTRKVEPGLHFGQAIRGREGDRDSRDWDTDDRNRDIEGSFEEEYARLQKELQRNQVQENQAELNDKILSSNSSGSAAEDSFSKVPGLSYERGRKELRKYEKQYEDDLLRESNATEADRDFDDMEDEYEESEAMVVRRAGKSMPAVQETVTSEQKHLRPPRKHRGACEINFANLSNVHEPDNSLKFARFDLKYVSKEEMPLNDSSWTPRFAGHQTLEEREDSFRVANKTIHCGFVRGPDPSESAGFDLSDKDTEYLAGCRVAVSSCIFGKSDKLHSPRKRKVSSPLKKEVCFVLFVDQLSLDVMLEEGQVPDENGFVGIWRVVLVSNLPYADFRRVGKIPKLLSHRLFPFARYSIWLDSKLRLQVNPLSILEYFLWRGNHEYTISNHYDRHCVWDEVQQNKRLNKFNHSLIDEQFLFYQQDGLTRFNASDPKRLLPSNVPEGSIIVRSHTPMSNLFSCLWFNEVDRFTPRDQLSFAYTYMKLVRTNIGTRFRFAMFKDCERKTIAKLYRHRQDDRASVQ